MITFCILLFLPARLLYQEFQLSSIASQNRSNAPTYSELARIIKPGEVVISDASDAIWWYADRSSIWIPVHYDDLKILFARDDCRYLYLARPIDFMNYLTNNEIADFAYSTELVTDMHGSGQLFRLKKAQLNSEASGHGA
jgi:hypothetical protein